MNPTRPSWIRWQVALWVWGDPAFLEHMEAFWQGVVVKRAPAPYNPQQPASGWWPIEMPLLRGEFEGDDQRAYGLTAIRQESEGEFFKTLADQLEKRARLLHFPGHKNLVCLSGGVTEMPAQYQDVACEVGTEPPKPGIVLFSPGGRINGHPVEVYRSIARYVGRPEQQEDIYSPQATADLAKIWLEEFRGPAGIAGNWRRARELDRQLPAGLVGAPRVRF